jgi:hypothetical protein
MARRAEEIALNHSADFAAGSPSQQRAGGPTTKLAVAGGPRVRIHLPPAASRTNFELIVQTLARYPLPDGISGLGGGGRIAVLTLRQGCRSDSRASGESQRATACPGRLSQGRHQRSPLGGVAARQNASSSLKPPRPSTHAFSSRLSSLRKRQSVPSAMIFFGLFLIMPSSCRRRA